MRKILSLGIVFLMLINNVLLSKSDDYVYPEPPKPIFIQTLDIIKEEEIIKVVSEPIVVEEPVLSDYEIKMIELETVEDKMQWYKEYKEVISEMALDERPITICDEFTNEEIELIFKVVQREVGDEYSFEEKSHVASVIFNRLKDGRFGETIGDILTPGQFHVLRSSTFNNTKVSEKTILAVQYAFEIEDTTDGCIFFEKNTSIHEAYSEYVFTDKAGHKFYRKETN